MEYKKIFIPRPTVTYIAEAISISEKMFNLNLIPTGWWRLGNIKLKDFFLFLLTNLSFEKKKPKIQSREIIINSIKYFKH